MRKYMKAMALSAVVVAGVLAITFTPLSNGSGGSPAQVASNGSGGAPSIQLFSNGSGG